MTPRQTLPLQGGYHPHKRDLRKKTKNICDAIKQNESEVKQNQILFLGIYYLRIL